MDVKQLPVVPLLPPLDGLTIKGKIQVLGIDFTLVPTPPEAVAGTALYRTTRDITFEQFPVTIILEYNPQEVEIPMDEQTRAIVQVGWLGRIALGELIVYPVGPVPIGVCYTPEEMLAHLIAILKDTESMMVLYHNALAFLEL